MFGWHVPQPNEALLISGSKKTDNDLPFRIVTGHGTFVVPIKCKVNKLTLAMQEAEVAEECVTQQGIKLNVQSVIAFKVGNDHPSIAAAGTRFLADQDQMSALAGQIFAGHLRSIVGSMTVEDIIRERQKLGDAVLDASKPEMAKLGLIVDSLQIKSIDDLGSGYIDALAAPHRANVQRDAQIAEAAANQQAAKAQQESAANQAQYARDTEVAKAGYKAEVDKAQATSAAVGPRQAAEAQQAVVDAEADLAVRQADLAAKKLVTEVQKPAEAEATRIETLAKANAEATRVQAEATASNNGIALQRLIAENMPEIMSAVASELRNANITVLDGADGMGRVVAGLGAQAGQLLKVVQDGLAGSTTPAASAPGTQTKPVTPTKPSANDGLN